MLGYPSLQRGAVDLPETTMATRVICYSGIDARRPASLHAVEDACRL